MTIDLIDLQARVGRILADYDPELLISLGAPKDEYKHEAKIVVEKLSFCSSIDQLEEVLRQIFHERFDLAYRYPQAKGDDWGSPVKVAHEAKPHPERESRLRQAAEDINRLIVSSLPKQ